jgi:glycosyltransferase involved in cell wall biosynthesis
MKILIVTNYLPNYSSSFISALSKKFFNSSIYVIADVNNNLDINQFKRSKHYRVLNYPIKFLGPFCYRFGIINKIIKINPDRVIFYGNPRDISVYLGLIFCKLKNIKTFTHGMFHRIGKIGVFTRFAYSFFFNLSTGCMTYSQKGAQVLYSLGFDLKKVFVIGNAIDEKKIFNKKKKLLNKEKIFQKLKKKYPNLNKEFVLQVVRMSKIKNPLLIVEAANYLIKIKKKKISFVIVGKGELFKDFNTLVKRYSLEKNFVILGDVYDENILSNWFFLAKGFVVPSCIGLSLHHAFAYGVPVITDNSIMHQSSEAEILFNNINGLTYKSLNIKDLANKIDILIRDKKLRSYLSKNALRTIASSNKLEDKVKKYSDVILNKF